MSFDFILTSIRNYVQLTEHEEAVLCSLLTTKTLKRKAFLLRAGDDARHEFFVNKGCLRTYYLDMKGAEHNTYFSTEGWWVSDIYGRTNKTPATCNIVALEDCELVHISGAALEHALNEIPALERFSAYLIKMPWLPTI